MGKEKWTLSHVEKWAAKLRAGASAASVQKEDRVPAKSFREAFQRHLNCLPSEIMAEAEDDEMAVTQRAPRVDAPAPRQKRGSSSAGEPLPDERSLEAKLFRYCQKKARTFEEVCNYFKLCPDDARDLFDSATDMGLQLDVQGDKLGWLIDVEAPEPDSEVVLQPSSDWYRFAVVGDIHFGNKRCRKDFLRDFLEKAYSMGVRQFFQVGDMLDGDYRHGRWELSHAGWEAQAMDAYRSLPYSKDCEWYMIDGNHEATFSDKAGFTSGRMLEQYFRHLGRHDLHFLGRRRGRMRLCLEGVDYKPCVELWHPKKGPAYALSYGLQKRVEAYPPGAKPDFLLTGHWHNYCQIYERGVWALSCGTFHGHGGDYSNSLSSMQALVGTVVSFRATPVGTIRPVDHMLFPYFERERERAIDMARIPFDGYVLGDYEAL